MSAVIGGSAAMGGTAPSHRLYDLGPSSLPPAVFVADRLIGLNNLGDVVWRFPASGGTHGAVWSFFGNFGLDPRTMYDLNDLSGQSVGTRARDINDGGLIVGDALLTSPARTRAHVWVLDDGEADAINLGIFGTDDTDLDSEAHGLNHSDPAIVVGWSQIGGLDCEEPDPDPLCLIPNTCQVEPAHVPFRWVSNVGALVALDLPAPPSGEGSNFEAHAIAVNASADVVGWTGPCGVVAGVACGSYQDAVGWDSSLAGDELIPVENDSFWEPRGLHDARAANDEGNVVGVGYGLPEFDPYLCGIGAPFWEDADSAPVNLRELLAVPEESEAMANGMNNPDGDDTLLVVGSNLSQNIALLWRRVGGPTGDWEVFDLNETICATGYELIRAFDVNDLGWIVGWGTKSQGSGQGNRAFLLVPIHEGCSADVNGDCFVDGVDLGFVLGQWSIPETAPGCEGEVPCHGDINCDGFVNGLDLGIVLAQWTGRDPCNENCGLGFESFSSSMSTQGISSYEEQLIETLIEMGLDDFAQQLEELLGLQ